MQFAADFIDEGTGLTKFVSRLKRLRPSQILLVAVVLVPALILLVSQAFEDRRQAEAVLAQEARILAVQLGLYSKELLPDPEIYLAQLATLPEVFSETAACSRFAKTLLKGNFFFHNIFVVAPNGDLACSGVDLDTPINVSHRLYFQRSHQSRKFSIGDFQRTRDGVPVIVFALPILDESNDVVAIIGASAELTWFQNAFGRSLIGTSVSGVSAAAIDESGLIIASAPSQGESGKIALSWDKNLKAHARKEIYVRPEANEHGVVQTTAYLPIYRSESANIYLRVSIPQEAALASVATETKRRIFFLFAFATIAAFASWCLSSWLVVNPIHRLKQTVLNLANGRLGVRTGIDYTSGEIGELAKHFDAMAQQLEAEHRTLTQLTRLQALRAQVNASVLRTKDETALLHEVCEIIRTECQFELVGAAFVNAEDPTALIWRAWSTDAKHGATMHIVENFNVAVQGDPVLAAATSGRVCILRRSTEAPNSLPQPSHASGASVTSVGFPIVSAFGVIGALGIYSTNSFPFDDVHLDMLAAAATDIGFGIASIRADAKLRQSQDRLAMIVDNIPTMIFVKDAKDFTFVSMNRAGQRLTGIAEDGIIGKTDFDLFSPDQAAYFRRMDEAALESDMGLVVIEEPVTTVTGEIRLVETKKIRILEEDGRPVYLLGISEDISERKNAEDRLTFLAEHDQLTELLNRYGLYRQFGRCQASRDASQSGFAALYIDLDGFKEVNDTLGHSVGDALLRTAAGIVKAASGNDHLVARVGGDEFVVVLSRSGMDGTAVALAEVLRQRFENAFYIEGNKILISASIGVSYCVQNVERCEKLLRNADIAMLHAKGQGGHRFSIYSPEMEFQAINRLAMRNELRDAIENGELTLNYQPRVSIETGRIVGAEALLRWASRELGVISPALFIPLAEETGLIEQIGVWVLEQACAQAQVWSRLTENNFRIAVNLSPRQLRQPDLVATIRRVLDVTGLRPEFLELEITEGATMDRESQSIAVLNEISSMGIRIAVDDFGTGYSNLRYLKQLPIHVLKIDQSFVRGVTNDKNDLAIVTAIVAMADSLSLSVTAEGIEQRGQLDIMRGLGVSDYQGFYFAKPMSPEMLHERLVLSEHLPDVCPE